MKEYTQEQLRTILIKHRAFSEWNGGERADLRGADLSGADLSGADLRWAYLRWAYLRGADLRGADLRRADLPPVTQLLLCCWGTVSDELCLELMRYDASNHPHPEKFDEWAKGGKCPYDNEQFQRCANFQEKRELWKAGKSKSAYELVIMLFKETGIKF